MPSHTILYTKYGNPTHQLCKTYRNSILVNQINNNVIIGGFGNLNG